jgi:NAD(P)-dependent dehydrogenase (short-subunit alcohol dehydrogenase family)
MVRTLSLDLDVLNIRVNLLCPFWTDTGIVPKEVLERSASAKRSMQPPQACSHAVAHLGLDRQCQGKVVYVAVSTYTDVDQGLLQCRAQWLGRRNHEDRLVWENDPFNAESRTLF